MGYLVVAGIVILVISGIVASKFEAIANMKGHEGYFWWCFWLGVIGYAMVIALPDRRFEIKFLAQATSPVKENKVSAPADADDTLPAL